MNKQEMIKKIMEGKLSKGEGIMVDLMGDSFMQNKVDKMRGIIYCWNCGAAMQKPVWISKIKGSGNSLKMKCRCGKSTGVKF